MKTQATGCTCYVLGLPASQRFTVRWGSHAKTCPVYLPSADPVDRASDEAFRASTMERMWRRTS